MKYSKNKSNRFINKKVLVTGAAGGIGQSLVKLFKEEGAIVAATDIKLSEKNVAACFEGDLMNASFCDTLPKKVAEKIGGLDIVCNNAGVITRGKITEATDEDYRLTMGINVEAPFRITRASIPIMRKGSSIINTSSCWGLRPGPNHPLYIMSKAALASLTQTLGRDHAPDGIRINAVCPNEVDTPMLRSGFKARGLDPQTAIESLNKSVPLGRIATPFDIAKVILFLASDEASYMCGSLVEVNGGKPVI
ncbi:MAG: short-chain dehydrogenase [Rhodobacteraceae bacterium]|nr:MAG: short-chain dehydrogenase [Paracoccaceae bacterium]